MLCLEDATSGLSPQDTMIIFILDGNQSQMELNLINLVRKSQKISIHVQNNLLIILRIIDNCLKNISFSRI